MPINTAIKFLEKEHAKCLSLHMAHVEPSLNPSKEEMFSGTKSVYADPVFESLLNFIKPKVEKACKKELVPTYSFWRTYFKTQDCPPHKDRPSCQISVTLCIDASDKKDMWDINVEDQVFKLDVGEGVIYRGCEQEHWRHELQYDWHRQVFLHYIEKNGEFYPQYKYDERPDLYYNTEVST